MPDLDELWIPLVDEPIGSIVQEIVDENPDVANLVESPHLILAFRTFAYIRCGLTLGQLLFDNDLPAYDGSESWVEALLRDPEHHAALTREIRAVAEEIAAGQAAAGTRVLVAPDDAVAFDGAFAYPADGSIVAASSVTTSVSATSGTQASAGATSQVTSLAIFKDEITAETVTGETHASAGASSASGDTGVTAVGGLVVLGQPVTPIANQQIPLADWGYAIALEQKGQRVDQPTPGHHDFVTALDVFLTADHGGLPAQSEIQIGYAEANAQASEPPPLPVAPSQPTTTGKQPKEPKSKGFPPVLSKPLDVKPQLGKGGDVF